MVFVYCVKSTLGWENYKLASRFEAYRLEQYKGLLENIAFNFYVSSDSHTIWLSFMEPKHPCGEKTKEPII